MHPYFAALHSQTLEEQLFVTLAAACDDCLAPVLCYRHVLLLRGDRGEEPELVHHQRTLRRSHPSVHEARR